MAQLETLGHFKFNLFTQRIEVQGEEIKTDALITEYRDLFLRTQNFSAGHVMMYQAIECVARRHAYDPLIEYLNRLEWDGELRVGEWLSDVYGVERTDYTRAAGLCWLISGVARGLNPGCKVRLVLLIQGLEDLGKSISLEDLCPKREWFTDSLPADLHSKDAAIALAGKWIVESPEMASMRRSAQEAIKAYLSRNIDDYRPPYARCNVQVPGRCILAATTNPADVLSAQEENTRYLPIKATEYNRDYLLDSRDQLWAEAVVLYKTGVKWWLTNAEVKEQARQARLLFVETDPWDDSIREWLEIRKHSTEPVVTAADALTHLGVEQARRTKREEMRITSIFKKFGWFKKHGEAGNKWEPEEKS